MKYRSGMERICTQCHAVLDQKTKVDWCPACGGALTNRPALPQSPKNAGSAQEVDHRGLLLPRRHALGGIITPQ
jgi:hypothetical protein